jgi:rhamnosyltransferase
MTRDVVVILSRYGECAYLEETLGSLRQQTVDSVLLLRCDNEAESGHLGIKGSFRHLLSQVPDACSYILFCDQDDVWFPRKIESLLAAMKKAEMEHAGPILVHGDAFVADEKLKIIKRRFISKWARHDDFFGTLMFNKVQGASMMINRPLFERIWDLPEEGPLYDRYIHLVAEIIGRRVFVDRPLMYYRQHGNNAIGAFGRKPRVRFEFLNEDDRALFTGNEYVLRRFAAELSARKRKIVDDYRIFMTTRDPIRRMLLIICYLRPYTGTMVKKLVKIFFK